VTPKIITSPSRWLPSTISATGGGKPDWTATASASGRARATAAASSRVMRGRLASSRISLSSSSPTAIGVRRTWNALLPMMAPVMFSLT